MSFVSLVSRLMAVSVVLGAFSVPAFAGGSVRSCGTRQVWRYNGCIDTYRRMRYSCYVNEYSCSSSCAPQAEKGNLAATQTVLEKLVATPEFASATAFKDAVVRIGQVQDSSVRFGEYMVLVGLQDSTQEDLLEFMGARTPDAKAVSSVKDQLELNNAQAEILIKEMAKAMRGSLN